MAVKTKIALVTGGSRGLGKNMAIAVAKKGIDVLITYNSKKEEADLVVKEIENLGQKAAAFQLNVGDCTAFDSFLENVSDALENTFKRNKLDFLINNAGIGIHNSFTGTTEAELDQLTNIHFKGPFLLTQKALNLMNDGGGIVNISSGLTRFSFPGYAAYAAMKGAIETLTKYQAKELGERKIRANVVAPGAIETDFGGGVVRDNEALNKNIASLTALGRVGLPDDIGGVVAFLCTEEAGWVNGQRIEVSGGTNL
jgi:NAD(P)-dependent dehydrogenase (short-subunit alcohol dehydrogenase family)